MTLIKKNKEDYLKFWQRKNEKFAKLLRAKQERRIKFLRFKARKKQLSNFRGKFLFFTGFFLIICVSSFFFAEKLATKLFKNKSLDSRPFKDKLLVAQEFARTYFVQIILFTGVLFLMIFFANSKLYKRTVLKLVKQRKINLFSCGKKTEQFSSFINEQFQKAGIEVQENEKSLENHVSKPDDVNIIVFDNV
jgi:hypothetical protein